MLSIKKIFNCIVFLTILSMSYIACVEKDIDPADPAAAFVSAREPYDNEMYEIAVQKLGEFKSRFPYSKHSPEAELLIADSHFQLGHYAESASAYELFVRLHPKHDKADFAQYRIGESYWAEAPEEIDREQEYTLKAIVEWEKLRISYPEGGETKKAESLLLKGRRRVAEHLAFIAQFYCKQKIYHACAFRYLELIEQYSQFADLTKNAYLKASNAFDAMSKEKFSNEKNDSNLYFRSMSPTELHAKAEELRKLAINIKS